MLWPLTLDDNNWRSMFHTLGIYYHALTVVTRWWQLTEYGSYLRDILPCSDRCQETITTDGVWLILKGYKTILWPLFFDDFNWRSMFHTLCIYHHALTVVVRRWQMTEHVLYTRDILPCMLHTLGIYYNALTVVRRRWQLKVHVSYLRDE